MSAVSLHPSTTIDAQVRAMRADLALVERAILGALDHQDHSSLSDLHVTDALARALGARFAEMRQALSELESVAAKIREKGAPAVLEAVRSRIPELLEEW